MGEIRVGDQAKFEDHREDLIDACRHLLPRDSRGSQDDVDLCWEALGIDPADPCAVFQSSGVFGLEHFLECCYNKKYLVEPHVLDYNYGFPLIWVPRGHTPYFPVARVSAKISLLLGQMLLEDPVFIPKLVKARLMRHSLWRIHNDIFLKYDVEMYLDHIYNEPVLDLDVSVEKVFKEFWRGIVDRDLPNARRWEPSDLSGEICAPGCDGRSRLSNSFPAPPR